MNNYNNETFFDRLKQVAADRKIGPWSESIGLTKTDMTRAKQGKTIGPEKLVPICRAENVSLSWLLDGTGAPYLVTHTQADADMAEAVQALLDEPGWRICIMHNRWPALVMTLPASMLVGQKEIPYTVVEIIEGRLGPKTAEVLQRSQYANTAEVLERDLDDETGRLLAAGKLGNRQLLPPDGLLGETLSPWVPESLIAYQVEEETGGLNLMWMQTAIRHLEDSIQETGYVLTPEKKSICIAAIYKLMKQKNTTTVDKDIINLILESLV